MLYLTYYTNIHNDGMGAQYQRIIGIICIAKYYNFIYVHSPITKMEHINDMTYINKIDDFFGINKNFKNVNYYSYDNVLKIEKPSINELLSYDKKNKNILIEIYIPYDICEKNIEIYDRGMIFLRQIIKNIIPLKKQNIIIHIRRGDVDMNNNNERYIDIVEYNNIINIFKEKYKNYNILVFTQIDENNKNEFDIYKNDKIVTIRANEDILITFNNLIHADILVICKSSFSYLAGMYNPNIVYYYDFWHKPLKHWTNINTIQMEHFYSQDNILYEHPNNTCYSLNPIFHTHTNIFLFKYKKLFKKIIIIFIMFMFLYIAIIYIFQNL